MAGAVTRRLPAWALLVQAGCGGPTLSEPSEPYDPLAVARARAGIVENLEAGVPPVCYTDTDGVSNPCWACHTVGRPPNHLVDWELQREYAFSDVALTNHWTNLFVDRSEDIAATTGEEVADWIEGDNYTPLRATLRDRGDFRGWKPDLDLDLGFDEAGFARDGSGWRAIRYQPFPGTFWPTNGATDDVYVRLPPALRPDPTTELAAYDLLEAVVTDGTDLPVTWPGVSWPVRAGAYPPGIEFLHTVRYVDLDRPGALSRRMKEVRYSRKTRDVDTWGYVDTYRVEADEKEEGRVPVYRGEAGVGLLNAFGWLYQGWIEDGQGRLRLQTDEEHRACLGCHGSLGVTVDSTFALPRKVPGAAGWQVQDLAGQIDRPQRGHDEGEVRQWLRRTGGGDELRANPEMLDRFFPGGTYVPERVEGDLATILLPSPERARTLNAAWMSLVRDQTWTRGRVALETPATNVFRVIENGDTELGAAGKVFADGTLLLER